MRAEDVPHMVSGAANDAALMTTVIPAYRCAPFLAAAVESVLPYTSGQILIAEDGSPDDTLAVALSWAARYPDRISVISNPANIGTSANLNRAFRHVSTPFIMKLDGDDVLVPVLVTGFLALLQSDPEIAIVSPSAIQVPSDWVVTDGAQPVTSVVSAGGQTLILSGIEAARFIIRWDPNPCSSGAIYRREAVLECGGFNERLNWGEDWELWFRLARRYKVAYDARPGALYRQHANSTTAAHIHNDRLCVAYERVYREGARLWPNPELRSDFRRALLRSTRSYLGAAKRSLLAHDGKAFAYVRRAISAIRTAAGAAYPRADDDDVPRIHHLPAS